MCHKVTHSLIPESLFLLCLFISVPPYIYALSFIEFFSFFNKPIISGLGISILVQTIYYIPFASLLFYIHIKGIHKSYFDETNLHLSTIKASFITIKELSIAPFSLIFLMILLLSINNYTIPSIFAFNTYPIEIMSVFSNSNNLLTTALITLPFLFFSIIISFIIFLLFKPYYTSYKISQGNNFNTSYNNTLLTLTFYLIILIQVITPIIFLLFDIESIKAIIPSIINNYNDILFTIISIFISSLTIVLCSTIFAYTSLINKQFKSFIILLSIILLTIPSSFVGIAIISMYNNLPFDILFYSPLLTSHTLLIRFIPISFLIIISDFNKYSKEYFDISIINTNSHLKIFKKVILPNSYKSLLYSFIVVSILAVGELGASIMIVPPGKSTLAITIYSYLHYGSSNSVKGLSLFVFISCIIFALLVLIIIKKKGETINYE